MNSKPEYLHVPSLIVTIPIITQDSIVSRTLFTDDQIKAVMFAFDKGQELSEHTASTPAIIHIVAGEAGARNTLLSGGCVEHPAILFASEVECAKRVR